MPTLRQKKKQEPVHERDGKWYFWDETWSEEYGVFNTKEEAEKALQRYVDLLCTHKCQEC